MFNKFSWSRPMAVIKVFVEARTQVFANKTEQKNKKPNPHLLYIIWGSKVCEFVFH